MNCRQAEVQGSTTVAAEPQICGSDSADVYHMLAKITNLFNSILMLNAVAAVQNLINDVRSHYVIPENWKEYLILKNAEKVSPRKYLKT